MAENGSLYHVYFFLADEAPHVKEAQDLLPRGRTTTTSSAFPYCKTTLEQTDNAGLAITTQPESSIATITDRNTSVDQTSLLRVSQFVTLNAATTNPEYDSSALRTHSQDSSTGSSINSRDSAFNPRAESFTPSLSRSATTDTVPGSSQYYTVCDSHGKGKGLFATEYIPRGTLIIREKPLISVANGLARVCLEYYTLLEAQKTTFNELHSYQPEYIDFKSVSISYLTDSGFDYNDKANLTSIVAEQVRIMSIFAANNFATSDENHLALFATIARINHSCIPNIYPCYSAYENCMTVCASQDIAKGTELLSNYIEGASTYQVRHQRVEQLRSKYGFTCQCPACSDCTGSSDVRRTILNDVMWGLQMYIDEGPGKPSQPYSCHPSSPDMALRQVKDALDLFHSEAIVNFELLKALRIASMVSLELGNLEGALQYTIYEHLITNNLVGPAAYLVHILNCGPASIWVEHIERMITDGQDHTSNAEPSPKNKKLSQNSKSGNKHSHYSGQAYGSPQEDKSPTNSEVENAQIAKAIRSEKKRQAKQKAKARRRAEAEAKVQEPAKSSVIAKQADSNSKYL